MHEEHPVNASRMPELSSLGQSDIALPILTLLQTSFVHQR